MKLPADLRLREGVSVRAARCRNDNSCPRERYVLDVFLELATRRSVRLRDSHPPRQSKRPAGSQTVLQEFASCDSSHGSLPTEIQGTRPRLAVSDCVNSNDRGCPSSGAVCANPRTAICPLSRTNGSPARRCPRGAGEGSAPLHRSRRSAFRDAMSCTAARLALALGMIEGVRGYRPPGCACREPIAI
jgi:hypothetical protein